MFFVVEVQNNNGAGATLVTTFTDRNQAESKFHEILKYAAVSSLTKHGAVVMTDDCVTILNKCYEHGEE